jgi:peptidoglycan/LPS O-acetylase OafA/YrhL
MSAPSTRSFPSGAQRPEVQAQSTGKVSDALRYRPEIDGLRALAVLAVIFFHIDIPGFSGGFVGVDIFFVISGFLITGLIHRELVEQRFSLLHFYERRARRILPPLIAVLLASTVGALLLFSSVDLIDYAKTLIATALFAANIQFWRITQGYFAIEAEINPLLHIWSLAVEEQFYVVFPLLLIAVHRWRPERVRTVILLCSAASLALAAWLVPHNDKSAFFLTPARVWELGLGALLALGLVPPARDAWVREMLGWSGLALILAPVFLYSIQTPFPGLAALPPCLGAAMILHLRTGSSRVSRWLTWPPLMFVGLISYSLYLWHWPLLAFARYVLGTGPLPLLVQLGVIFAAAVLAVVSWSFIEQPFRGGRFTRKQIFRFAVAAMAVLIAAPAGIRLANGLPGRFSPEANLLIAGRSDFDPDREACQRRTIKQGLCRLGEPNAPLRFLLWGDSHASALKPAAAAAAVRLHVGGLLATRPGCAPLIGYKDVNPACPAENDATLAFLSRHREIKIVILDARWTFRRTGRQQALEERGIIPDHAAADTTLALTAARFDRAVARTISALRGMGKRVIVVGDVPEVGWDVPARLFMAHRFGISPGTILTWPDVWQRQGFIERGFTARAAAGEIAFVPLLRHFCPGACRLTLDGAPLYLDNSHVSATAARRVVAPLLAPVLDRELKRY